VATTTELVEHLSRVPIFESCSKKELQTIAKQVREITHEAGHVIAAEGEPGAGLFVIDAGEADVTIGGRKVNHMKAGEFFGEMALLDGGPRTATVTATTDITLYALTEWVFRGLIAEHPGIAMRTLETMASRLRSATKAATA
jgi:CRP/FNR family transcriptional regulator, cyclic AMP receptor protein